MQALNLYPLDVIFADYDLPRSSRPALAKTSCVSAIAEPSLQSVLVFALHASLGAAAVAGTILALFAWSGAGL